MIVDARGIDFVVDQPLFHLPPEPDTSPSFDVKRPETSNGRDSSPRHPFPAIYPASRSLPIETARRLDVMVLRWAR
ncbi:MAG: hypothetical protein EOP82_31545 [Variovorax sp.]|nr:MAG: hypothetical protein EOP82_31545 [Variovorax sp.]